ncbi:hypothetical protein AALP_AA1G051100 [Arabis alpina]|uniref:Transcription repressor n=1 Tax=Arabis alpina TaxID=50452 RepID=A0A087HL81_ARAAL|nr:hypothetical protein AALP_AA1G051100 [Arabis alpina]
MWKNFHLCFPSNLIKPSSDSDVNAATAASSDDPNRPSILLINNFNLLYDDSVTGGRRISKRLMDVTPSSTTTTTTTATTTFTASTSTAANSSSSSTSESDNYGFTPGDHDSPPPDLTTVLASRRFFFSSPGRSNSITDSPDLRPRNIYETATTTNTTRLLTGGTAVKQYVQSPDPYNDFRRSMQEMIDAVTNVEDSRSYDFLHELLLSYLSLNAVDTHKFIIRAFADILVSLLSDGHRTS